MKKLLGIMAVVALLAAPGWAQTPVGVEINVATYLRVVPPAAPLVMAVTDLQATAVATDGTHQATTTFQVWGNTPFSMSATPNEISSSVIWTPGMEGTPPDLYPTARLGVVSSADGIGYGMALSRTSPSPASDGYTPDEGDCRLGGFVAGVSDCQIKINCYLDSGRLGPDGPDGGKLAEPGAYTGTITVTLSAP